MVELEQNKFEIIVLFLIMNFMLLSFHASPCTIIWCGYRRFVLEMWLLALYLGSYYIRFNKSQLERLHMSWRLFK